jgi:hypothetical protein
VSTLTQPADSARRDRYRAERVYPYGDAHGAYPRFSRQQVECERARHEDPAGVYRGFPCSAREAFGAGSNRGTRR